MKSMVYKMRCLADVLRFRFRRRSYAPARGYGDLLFFLALAIPVVVLGVLLRFAHGDQARIASERVRQRDLTCLARNIYFEARGEPMAGQYAVAEVTLNRVASRHFPNNVCDVVHEQRWDSIRKRYVGAFSWTELDTSRKPGGVAWKRAIKAASAVYDRHEAPRVDDALFYHARYIEPRWAKTKKPIAKIGKHIFYK
jgi:N-acetylmuramoyl-L-alanine amidase